MSEGQFGAQRATITTTPTADPAAATPKRKKRELAEAYQVGADNWSARARREGCDIFVSGFKTQAAEWRARAEGYLNAVAKGEDPYPKERGRIVSRGYRSPISTRIQGYTVYVPPDYTPEKSYPLMIVLHGGACFVRQGAACVLELDGGMVDPEPLAQHAVHVAQNRVACRRGHIVDQHMTA